MEAKQIDSEDPAPAVVDWEAFYRSYRKPGYLSGFEIVNKLGGGMFGLVFKARKESIGKDYAIKFLKVDDESVRDAVMREIDNVSYFAQIDHPNLVSIEDKGAVDGIPYLVMSYAGDETLQKRLEQGDMTREAALHIFVQAARGVQALHDHSLVHFDLKPANIFIKGDVARVGDYGLSKLVSVSRNSLSFGRGTPYYMAPELLQRRGDARSDVYSLGILLYECLYGEVPFRGDSEWEVLRKHETAQPEFPVNALQSDRDLILRCLEKRPEDRFQSAAELLRAMQAPVALGESMMLSGGSGSSAASPKVDRKTPPPLPLAMPSRSASSEPPPLPQSERERGRAGNLGMPFLESDQSTGVIGGFVRLVFVFIDVLVRVVVLPVAAVSAFFGRCLVVISGGPYVIMGFAARVITVLVMIAMLWLMVAVLASVFASMSIDPIGLGR